MSLDFLENQRKRSFTFFKKIKHCTPMTYTLSFWHVQDEKFVIKYVIYYNGSSNEMFPLVITPTI